MRYLSKIAFVLLALILLVPACAFGAGINEAYKEALAEWKSAYDKAVNEGNPYGGSLAFDFYDNGDPGSAKAYYALYDIDGNGTPELILRKTNKYEDIIAYIFAVKDGKAVNIFGYYGKELSSMEGKPREVPWSRDGASIILASGLIDSTEGDYAIYIMGGDGCS
ncbi:MAG: hypothetical protein FWG09_04180, partial [Synergistaceae bacterium]|nr:hypothetical protein [Synergistaceae bacterium]